MWSWSHCSPFFQETKGPKSFSSYFAFFFFTHGSSEGERGWESDKKEREVHFHISCAVSDVFLHLRHPHPHSHETKSPLRLLEKKARLRRDECGSLISEIFSRVAHMAECALTSRRSRSECVYVLFPDFFSSVLRVARRFFFRYNGVSISLDPFFMKLVCGKTVGGTGNDWWIREKRKRKSFLQLTDEV